MMRWFVLAIVLESVQSRKSAALTDFSCFFILHVPFACFAICICFVFDPVTASVLSRLCSPVLSLALNSFVYLYHSVSFSHCKALPCIFVLFPSLVVLFPFFLLLFFLFFDTASLFHSTALESFWGESSEQWVVISTSTTTVSLHTL